MDSKRFQYVLVTPTRRAMPFRDPLIACRMTRLFLSMRSSRWEESTVGAKSIEQLPENARAYIARLEALVGAPIDIVSTGPDREETIVLRDPFG